jgi:hypothetical protein
VRNAGGDTQLLQRIVPGNAEIDEKKPAPVAHLNASIMVRFQIILRTVGSPSEYEGRLSRQRDVSVYFVSRRERQAINDANPLNAAHR